ncbi:MAG: hypothetical protein RMJ17_03465 [Candidatus Aenigmarchaeota archaeon]|nr:hypothetical protein [Candidatus Aenigmarchaeota archaeon]MDW8149624.1 hypothetical protein [Candidatus Aenigmarchaeota archaeon]
MRKYLLILLLATILSNLIVSRTVSKGDEQFNITNAYTLLTPFNNFAGNISIGNLVDYDIIVLIENKTLHNSLSETLNFYIFNGTSLDNKVLIPSISIVNSIVFIIYTTTIKPGRYIGNVSLFNQTNYSINITEFLLIADIPVNIDNKKIEFFYNFSRLNTVYSLTQNPLDVCERFILNVSQPNISTITLIFNDTLYFLHSDIENDFLIENLLNKSSVNSKRIVYIEPNIDQFSYLNFFSKNNSMDIFSPLYLPFEVKILKSSINFSIDKCEWYNAYYKHLVCPVNANEAINAKINISNNLDINYSNVALTYDKAVLPIIERERILFDKTSQLNRSYEFFLPEFVDEILLVIDWDHSTSDFNVSIENIVPYRFLEDKVFGFEEKAYSNLDKNKKYKIIVESNNTDFYDIYLYFYVNFPLFSTNYNTTNFSSFETKHYSINFSLPQKIFGSASYWQYIKLIDENNTTTLLPLIIINNEPNLEINGSYRYLNINLKENIGLNKTIKIPLVITNKNYTDHINNNLTITNIENSTSLKSGLFYINYSHDLNLAKNLNISSSNSYPFNITLHLDTSKHNNSVGIFSDNLKIVSLNGLPERNFTIFITLNLTSELITKIINVTNQTDGKNIILPNSYFNVTLSVFYQNNSFVKNLNSSNFTITLERYVFSTKYVAETNVENVYSLDNSYILNVSSGNILGGNFTLKVNVTDGRKNFGVSEFKNVSVNESLLTLHASPSSSSFSYTTQIPISLTVFNHGLRDEHNIIINAYSSGCSITPTSLTISFINYSSSYSNSSAFIAITQNNTNCSITINSSNPKFLPFFKESSFLIIYEPLLPRKEAREQDQPISYSLEIVEYEDKVYVQRNRTNSTIVKVKNPSIAEQTVYLTIKDLGKEYFEIIPFQQTIDSFETKSFIVKLYGKNLSIDIYNLTFLAYSSNANASKKFKLIILPSYLDIEIINISLTNLTAMILKLEENITMLEKEGINMSFLKNELNNLKNELNNLKENFEKKNYLKIYENIDKLTKNVNELIDSFIKIKENIAQQLKKEEKKKGINIFDIIIIAIIIVAIAFLVYLLLPVKLPV